eukprot:CAMPEP_0184988412 /NCGR_PEP_ID=MMETSP1098-20130426/24371_1 /TAXON_ID=89044 /ORGANISM="Spumella elongata, Strain CCAP 955/1" /LENGTH=520 /DNA_ID=CAMNT_0027513155 /DNA_START=56 /DNA_END=1618 /DNA_ORIENTATION=+
MSDYRSFYYLMSQGLGATKPVFMQPLVPLTFEELYSPREGTVLIGKSEKHYWRTRDRIQFHFYANRANKVVFITCCNLDNREVYRTIFLNMETLYFEVECKSQEGNRTKMVRKREKKLFTDEMLHRSVVEYIRARVFITNDLLLWPDFTPVAPTPAPVEHDGLGLPILQGADARSPVSVEHGALELPIPADTEAPVKKPVQYFEKMVTFNKLSNDYYGDNLEINKPEALSLEGILHTKTLPDDWQPPSPPKPVEVAVEVAHALSPDAKKPILPRKSSKYGNSRRPSGAVPVLALGSASTPTLPSVTSPLKPVSSSTNTHMNSPVSNAVASVASYIAKMTLQSASADAVASQAAPTLVNLSSYSLDAAEKDITPLTTTTPALNALEPDTNPISSSDKPKQVVAVTKVKYPPLIKGQSSVNRAPRNTVLTKQTSNLKVKPVVKGPVPAAIATAGVQTMPSTPAAPQRASIIILDPVQPTPAAAAAASAEKKKKASPLAAAGARAQALLSSATKKPNNKVVPV